MQKENYYVGQRVKTFDEDEECNVYGHVKKIDKDGVHILWSDMSENTLHSDPADLAKIFDSLKW